jgi:hypothetical protein
LIFLFLGIYTFLSPYCLLKWIPGTKNVCNISYYALQDHLSAIDILAACNLVNYFGKAVLGGNGVGQISMYPVLLQKVVSLRERMDLVVGHFC